MTVEILSTGSILNSKTKLVCGATDYEFDRFKTCQTSGEFSTLTSASSDSILFLEAKLATDSKSTGSCCLFYKFIKFY